MGYGQRQDEDAGTAPKGYHLRVAQLRFNRVPRSRMLVRDLSHVSEYSRMSFLAQVTFGVCCPHQVAGVCFSLSVVSPNLTDSMHLSVGSGFGKPAMCL